MRRLSAIFLLLAFFSFYPLKAEITSINGQLSGGTNIRSVQSQYFLIIFPEQCVQSAMELRQNADLICQKICSQMNMTCPFNAMPVVITQSTDVYNAYFSNASYNHIVLFDAAATEDLSVYSNTLLSTFEHELTHALTVNQKSDKFRHRLCNMIYWGDFIETPSMIKEGAAVAQESRGGQGRLNSSYFLHTIRQAKLSGEFPSWPDVLGSRDIYPAGSTPYIFGSSFTQWLQEKYGMQKYADFWWEIINNFHITFRGGFQKVYGVNLNAAWKEFVQSVQVPSINSNPLAEEFVGDFFRDAGKASGKSGKSSGKAGGNADGKSGKPAQGDQSASSSKPAQSSQSAPSSQSGKAETKKLDRKNTSGYRYTGLASCKNGFAYIEGETSSVYFSAIRKDGSFEKPKKLFAHKGIASISLSPDGAFLALSYYSYNSMNIKTKVKLYNMQTGDWTSLDETGLRDATVLIARGEKEGKSAEYSLAAVKVCGQKSYIKTYRIKEGQLEEDTELFLGKGEAPFSLCGGSGGNIAFLCRQDSEWKIRNVFAYGKNAGKGIEYSLDKDVELRDLSFYYGTSTPSGLSTSDYPSGEESLAFSLAMPGTFPRLGIIEGSGAYILSTDVSGGIYSPVCLGESTAYSAHFYTDSKLLKMHTKSIPLQSTHTEEKMISLAIKEKGNAGHDDDANSKAEAIQQEEAIASFLADAKPYRNMFQKKLSVLPFSNVPQYDDNGAVSNSIVFPGVMGIFATPWDNEILSISTGWDIFSGCGGLAVGLQGGSMQQTQFFVYGEEAALTYDKNGIRQFSNNISVSNTVQVGKTGSITATERNLLVDGKQKLTSNDDYDFSLFGNENAVIFASTKMRDSDNQSLFNMQNALSLEYSNIHQTGSGYWNRSGFSFKTVYANKYLRNKDEDSSYSNSQLFPSATIRIGNLIPIDCRQGLTYNLPVGASASLCYNSTSLFKFSAEAVLFASEIQKGISAFPLYFKRFSITGGYAMRIAHLNGNMEIFRIADALKEADRDLMEDAVYLTASFYQMINTGVLASPSIVHKLSLSFRYQPHTFNDEKKYVLGIGSSFTY